LVGEYLLDSLHYCLGIVRLNHIHQLIDGTQCQFGFGRVGTVCLHHRKLQLGHMHRDQHGKLYQLTELNQRDIDLTKSKIK
jgi:hypothetical protein